jgi:hypothetical protein
MRREKRRKGIQVKNPGFSLRDCLILGYIGAGGALILPVEDTSLIGTAPDDDMILTNLADFH